VSRSFVDPSGVLGEVERPEIVLEYDGVTVYHTYHDQGCVSEQWYATDILDYNAEDGGESQFDLEEVLAAAFGGTPMADRTQVGLNDIRDVRRALRQLIDCEAIPVNE